MSEVVSMDWCASTGTVNDQSVRKASTGFNLAARIAGTTPAANPISIDKPNAPSTKFHGILTGSPLTNSLSNHAMP